MAWRDVHAACLGGAADRDDDPAQHGGNAIGLGIGTGFEWRTLCGRLARHQMLFVLETDLTAARLALSICDVTALVSSAKLVLLVGEQPEAVEAQLLSFLAANHGVDPPSVMHALGTLSAERRNMLLSLGERIIRRAIGERSARFDALATQLASFGEPWQAGVRLRRRMALTLTPATPTIACFLMCSPRARTCRVSRSIITPRPAISFGCKPSSPTARDTS